MSQRFAVNADVQRGEQVNRSSSAVVFDVEHGGDFSVCAESKRREVKKFGLRLREVQD